MFKWMRSRRATTSDGDERTGLERREMLRLGGMAAVGAAGAAVVSVAGAPPADAAAGGNMVLGRVNDAGTTVTTLNSGTLAGALRVSNVANGAAIRVDSTPTAVLPVIQSTSSSAQPAIQVTGMPVAAGGAVAAAGNGPALSVRGVVAFARSGVATIPPFQHIVTVNVPGGVTAFTGAIATVQTENGGWVLRATPDPATGTLTIQTNSNILAPVKVAWFVFG